MLETKEQKQIFGASIVLILVLGLVSFLQRADLNVKNNIDYQALQKKSQADAAAEQAYLQSLNVDSAASKQLLTELLPDDVLKQKISDALDVNQKITMPVIQNSDINISNQNDKQAVSSYVSLAGDFFDQFKQINDSVSMDLFDPSGDQAKVQTAGLNFSHLLAKVQKMEVPQDAVAFHKAVVGDMQAYKDLLDLSSSFAQNASSTPWPAAYKQMVVIDNFSKQAEDAYGALNTKYKLSENNDKDEAGGNIFVPAAHAQLAVIDIWAKAQEILQVALATVEARFALDLTDKLLKDIEKFYKISNFLYYTDALVNGEYTDDYLNKYIPDATDKTIIKKLVTEVSCGQTPDLKQAFKAKADSYLGFDPQTVDPSDPDFYTKMAKVGNFLSSPQGWEIHYQDAAAQAQAVAEKSAELEVLSPGLKSSRDPNGDIISPVVDQLAEIHGIFQDFLNLKPKDIKLSAVDKVTIVITQNLLNNYAFRGVVLKEQKTCIPVPVVDLIVPSQQPTFDSGGN